MANLARHSRRDPVIRHLSASLVNDLAPKYFRREIETLFNFVRNNIRYTQDINEVETVQVPVNTLGFGYGDCDDMATLLASMLESIGHPSRFVAVALENPNQFDHVYVQTRIGPQGWLPLDATEPYPSGWQPPGILTYYIQDI